LHYFQRNLKSGRQDFRFSKAFQFLLSKKYFANQKGRTFLAFLISHILINFFGLFLYFLERKNVSQQLDILNETLLKPTLCVSSYYSKCGHIRLGG